MSKDRSPFVYGVHKKGEVGHVALATPNLAEVGKKDCWRKRLLAKKACAGARLLLGCDPHLAHSLVMIEVPLRDYLSLQLAKNYLAARHI